MGGGNEVILSEQDKVVSDQPEVCEIFNNYFVNVAKDIGGENDKYKEDFFRSTEYLEDFGKYNQK